MPISIMLDNLTAAQIDLELRQTRVLQLQALEPTIPHIEALDRAQAQLVSAELYVRRIREAAFRR